MQEELRGETAPLHTHPGARETFYVLAGQVEVRADGGVAPAIGCAFIVSCQGYGARLRRLSDEPGSDADSGLPS